MYRLFLSINKTRVLRPAAESRAWTNNIAQYLHRQLTVLYLDTTQDIVPRVIPDPNTGTMAVGIDHCHARTTQACSHQPFLSEFYCETDHSLLCCKGRVHTKNIHPPNLLTNYSSMPATYRVRRTWNPSPRLWKIYHCRPPDGHAELRWSQMGHNCSQQRL